MEIDRANFLGDLEAGDRSAYRRVYEAFRDAVRAGQLVKGQQVPSSRELAARQAARQ